ncbi:MAG: SEC-C metal-binding domain-containing protein [Eubacteriales bacterium]|nr:SEC-C metal-binding domain-containing protein [Eubacteriales bacterium]
MATSILENWHEKAYNQNNNSKKIWDNYFLKEKNIYKKILSNPKEEISGTVIELATLYDMDIESFVGFLEGINDSIKKDNKVAQLKENSKVKILIEPEKLYANMIKAKANWLYELSEWDTVLSKERRNEIMKEVKSSLVIKREKEKIYPNDPCPCGSGKKYKKCCGKGQ